MQNDKKIQYNKNKKFFNFDDLIKYLLVLRFDKHLLSSMINHEYYQKLPKIKIQINFYKNLIKKMKTCYVKEKESNQIKSYY
jgi:hypothetical protein